MMELLAFAALIMSIIALVKASEASRRAERLEKNWRDEAMPLPPIEADPAPAVKPGPEVAVTPGIAPLPTTPATDAMEAPATVETPIAAPPVLPPPFRLAASPASKPPPLPTTPALASNQPRQMPVHAPAPSLNLEQFLGAKLFAWLGGLAMFLGVVYFVKYAFEHNWISPAVRCGLGYILGLGCIGFGLWVSGKKRYAVLGQTLTATGVLVLYGVTFTAYALYKFPVFSQGFTFAVMVGITALAIVLASRMEAQVVAVLGILGGFLTPPLCATGEDRVLILFGYVALLDIGTLYLAQQKRWHYLAILAAAGTILMEYGWMIQHVIFGQKLYAHGTMTWVIVAVYAGFAWLFSAASEACRRREAGGQVIVASAALFMALSAMMMTYISLDRSLMGLRPWLLYTFVLLVNGSVLWVAWQHRKLLWVQTVFGLLTFLHLALWTGAILDVERLPIALATYLVFGVLHSLFAVAAGRGPMAVARTVLMPYALLIIAIWNLAYAEPTLVFGFAALQGGVLLNLAWRMRHAVLPLATIVCVLLVEAVWQAEHVNFMPAAFYEALPWYLGFFALFAAYPFVTHHLWTEKRLPWIATCVSSIGTFFLLHDAIRKLAPDFAFKGLLPAAFALVPLAGLFWIKHRHNVDNPARNTQLAWFGGTVLFFVTLVFPVQFGKEWLTIGWALEGAALCWLFLIVPHPGLRYTALGLLVVAFARLAVNPAVLTYHERTGAPVWNWFLYAYGLVALAMFAAAWWSRPPHHRVGEIDLRGLYGILGGVLLFLLLNIEIADAFTGPGERFITFQFSGNLARDMTYTITWSVFALILLIIGFGLQSKGTRYAGIALMGLTLLKLFFHDLADIGGIYRIGALMVVAVIAFAASFLYQRFAVREAK